MIRLTIPSIDENDLKAVGEVLTSGYLVQGERVAAFEKAVADYVGTKYAVAVSSGTAALHLALLTIGISPGDLVIVTAYSWPATANVIELCGAQPVFVDICSDTFNMDPECLAKELKRLMAAEDNAHRVKAILPVHTFGQMADMLEILDLADQYNLPVIEDAACALGATLNGRRAGTWGVMGCFSFHPRKAITTGEGGIITTDDPESAKRMRALRNHGQDPEAASPEFIMPGFNYRMTEFQAALGVSQMSKLDRIIMARRQRARIYTELLDDTPLKAPKVFEGSNPVYQSYVVLLPEHIAFHRRALIEKLKDKGIETTIGTWNMPLTT
ncbi:MAG: DegT/DnrJ/EryC1/StrS family aminotransferase, partial [Deltaproteobacteria bacterium]|nr:DegT/DnrJ/EryC1/StrS family aminotransferase [Deltaproteobacteria bacterium]